MLAQKIKNILVALLCIYGVSVHTSAAAEENNETNPTGSQEVKAVEPKEAKLFDMPLFEATRERVNQHFAKIGGFKQSRASFRKKHYDKFYSISQLADSYYLDFRFNSAEQLTLATQLYRPFNDSLVQNIDRNSKMLTTRRLAVKMSEKYGPPTGIIRKGWGGFKTYNAYYWEDEQIKISIDRQGNEALGNVFVQYQMKNIPSYLATANP